MSISLLPVYRSRYQTKYRKQAITACLALLASLPVSGSLYAQTLAAPPPAVNIQLQASETWQYDSNPLRQVRNNISISGTNSTVSLTLNDNTPVSQFSAMSQVDQGLFDDNKFNSTDFHEKANLFTKNERWSAGVGGTLDYDTTRTSEITNYGISIPSVRHLGWSASPEVDFTPTLGQKIRLAGYIAQSTYDNVAFTDYDFYQLSPSYSYSFDAINTGMLTIKGERYKSKSGTANTIDSYGPSLGWTRIISPKITAKVAAGAEYSTQSTPNASDKSQINYVFSGNLAFKEQQDNLVLYTSRSQQPFGNGSSALFTTFKANETHSLNDKLALTGMASYRYADYLQKTGVNLDREISGSAGIQYRFLTNLDINTNYQYNNQTLTNTSGAIKEHMFLVGLSYHPLEKGL